jgi:type IV pilus assembly protein PilE
MIIGTIARARKRGSGFTLIELLLVLAIVGIISAIVIPTFLGQRRRARIIGDASANCRAIAMQLEAYKADNGNYGPANATATWTYNAATHPHYAPPTLGGYTINPMPGFAPSGSSGISFSLIVNPNQQAYTLDAIDPTVNAAGAPVTHCVFRIDQSGREVFRAK